MEKAQQASHPAQVGGVEGRAIATGHRRSGHRAGSFSGSPIAGLDKLWGHRARGEIIAEGCFQCHTYLYPVLWPEAIYW